MVNRGDLIVCILKFEMESNGKVPVVFCLNGDQVTDEELLMECDKTTKQLYPYVGMGQHGVQVLAKVKFSVCPLKNAPSHSRLLKAYSASACNCLSGEICR